MKKPLIGILPLIDTEKESYWMLPDYMSAVDRAGGIGVMLPVVDDPQTLSQLADRFDGFLFTGGPDISPTIYGETSAELCGEIVPARDTLETRLLTLVLERNKPVLGICRGMQLINAALGGTLIQDIPSQFPSQVDHRQPKPYNQPIHSVSVTGPLAAATGADAISVNSCHHQGIKALAPCLEAMATAADGLIEAVWMPEKAFLWAFQWHPEMLRDTHSDTIFRVFVDAAK